MCIESEGLVFQKIQNSGEMKMVTDYSSQKQHTKSKVSIKLVG